MTSVDHGLRAKIPVVGVVLGGQVTTFLPTSPLQPANASFG